MRIKRRGRQAALTVRLTSENLAILRGVPSPYRFSGNVLLFEPTPESIRYIREHFPDEKVVGLDEFKEQLIDKSQAAKPSGEWHIDWEPYEHQKEAFRRAWNKKWFMYRMGVQTGKSATAILNASWLAYKGYIDAVLIIAPNGVHRKWIKEELPKFWPSCVPHCAAAWSSAMKKDQVMKFEDAYKTDKISILSFNIEAFSVANKRAEKTVESWIKDKRVFLILDESHLIKTPGSKRTKALFRIRKHADFVRTLTGTAGSPLDYYSQYNFLNPSILGFSTFEAFKRHFAVMIDLPDKKDRWGRPIRIVATDKDTGAKKYRNLDQLRNMIEPYTFTIATEDCNDLPPKLYSTIPVPLTKEQERLYNDLKEDLIVEFAGRDISAPLVIQKMTRFRQIVGGFLPDEENKGIPINKTNPRLERMIDKIEELEGPLIVWASFHTEIQMIADRLRKEYGADQVVTYYGKDNKSKREADRERFQNGDVRFFVSNPVCGGIGFSLYVASQMIFYSNPYGLKPRQQAEGRILAREQKAKHCVFIDMIAEGTIDERIRNALINDFAVESKLTGRQVIEWLEAE